MSLDKSVVETLEDHEERIGELEQNGGGGGGTPDRIESPSGDAFSEATDDYRGAGWPGSIMGAESSDCSAHVEAFSIPGGNSRVILGASPDGVPSNGAGFFADYFAPPFDLYYLSAFGAPLSVEEPTDSSHAATKGYVDARLPTLEWWEPVWTPVENVDSVSNVECQYTRTYRAAGGSLVTLEGTIEVTPEVVSSQCVVIADLPIAKPGAQYSIGLADGGLDDLKVSVADAGDGDQIVISGYARGTEAVPVTFRISYRAA